METAVAVLFSYIDRHLLLTALQYGGFGYCRAVCRKRGIV